MEATQRINVIKAVQKDSAVMVIVTEIAMSIRGDPAANNVTEDCNK